MAERRRCRGCDSYFCEIAGCASPRHYEDGDDDVVSPTQPFPTPKTVRSADTIDADTPSNFDPNAEDTGTAVPARSCRPARVPLYNAHGLYTSRTPTRFLMNPLNEMIKILYLTMLSAPWPRPTRPTSCR